MTQKKTLASERTLIEMKGTAANINATHNTETVANKFSRIVEIFASEVLETNSEVHTVLGLQKGNA